MAVTVCSTAFETLGRRQAASLGCVDLPIALVPHPFGLRSRAELPRVAADVASQIAKLVTRSDAGSVAPTAFGTHPEMLEVPDDIESMHRFFVEQKMSDGLPVIPPTAERIARMLAKSASARNEVIACIAPAYGEATVARIAANAVMAGCMPQCMNTLIAAVRAIASPEFNLQGIQATTNPAAVWLVVNGPVAAALEVNGGANCLGQGSSANVTLGRALRLIMQNIGGAFPGEMDRATQGQPGKYTFCCAENEADSPWQPLHVERGFNETDSTVTIVGAAGTVNFNSHAKDATDLLKVIADSLCFPTNNDYYFGGEPWLLLGPEHAEILAREGLSKRDVKLKLWEMSKLHVDRLAAKDRMRLQHTRGAELGQFGADTKIPISIKPEEVSIVVAGGPGTHSVHVPTFGHTRSVTKIIK